VGQPRNLSELPTTLQGIAPARGCKQPAGLLAFISRQPYVAWVVCEPSRSKRRKSLTSSKMQKTP
jgi:hypothetical protein